MGFSFLLLSDRLKCSFFINFFGKILEILCLIRLFGEFYIMCIRYFFLIVEFLLIRWCVMWLFCVNISKLVELIFSWLVGVNV